MARLAFQDLPQVQVDARETQRSGPTYTFDTLTELRREHPQAELFLFIGSDQAQAFQTWHQWQGILKLAMVVEARRGQEAKWHNSDLEKLVVSVVLQMPNMPCNATEIRASMAHGRPISEWLSPSVLHYIQQHRLYQTTLTQPLTTEPRP